MGNPYRFASQHHVMLELLKKIANNLTSGTMMMFKEGWRVMGRIIHKYTNTHMHKHTTTQIQKYTNTDSGDDDVSRGLASNGEH